MGIAGDWGHSRLGEQPCVLKSLICITAPRPEPSLPPADAGTSLSGRRKLRQAFSWFQTYPLFLGMSPPLEKQLGEERREGTGFRP